MLSHKFIPNNTVLLTNDVTGDIFTPSVTTYIDSPTIYTWTSLCPGSYTISATDYTGYSEERKLEILCDDNSCPKQGSTCVSILPRPKALFTSEPAATNGILNLCKGETVQFTNTSEDAPQTEWDFGDGTVSVLDEPLHRFSTPGCYEVRLIAGNGCICADTSKITVMVSDAEIPEIQCLGPICVGDTATYRTNVTCGHYDWAISPNGSIIGGGGIPDDFVTVQWNIGNSGSIQLTATGCTSNVCDKPVREVVSILGGAVTIEGPSVVCPNTSAEYSIPNFQGSDLTWSVTGSGALIAEGQNTHKITVQWGSTGGTVSLVYNNCFLECGGSGQKQVQVKPPSYLEGPIEVCVGDNPFYRHKALNNSSLISSNWQILNASGAVVWSPSNTPGQVNPTWNFPPGQYTIRAVPTGTSGGSCSAEAGLPVTVFGPPPAPSISGITDVCPSLFYTYTAQTTLANAEFQWTIKNGNSLTTKTGSSVTVKWGATPPYVLTLTQTDKSGPGCGSAPFTLEVQPLPPLTISGPGHRCKETIASYSTQQSPGIDYQWAVEPASAGGILSGQGTASVEVFWQTPGLHNLKLSACGSESSFPVEITAPIAPQIMHPDSLCPGAVATVSAIGNYTSLIWKDENGNSLSTATAPSFGPGHYVLEANDAAGCASASTFFMAPLPLPEAKIKSQSLSVCNATVTLYALESQEGYSFQWLRNGQPIGTDEATFDATLPGSYQVQVAAQNGCTALSAPFELVDCNTGGGGNPGPPAPPGTGQACIPANDLFFAAFPLSTCDSAQVLNLSQNMQPNSQVWQVYDPLLGSFYQSTAYEPAFSFDEVGFYLVRLWGTVPNQNNPNGAGCPTHHDEYVRIPLVAQFSAIESCAGLPTRFTDGSTFLPETSITAWSWDFGDPSSGAENTSTEQHPSHVFGQTGIYTVTLTATSSTGCEVSFAKDVTVHGSPTVSFAPPTAICAAAALNFTATGGNGAISYTWDFGDPASGDGNFSQNQSTWHAYPEAGNYTVTATAANIYGCTTSHTASVSSQANDLSGEITPQDPAPICEGLSASFTAPSGGSAWSWSNGATTSSISASAAGVYAVTVTDAEGCVYKPEPVILEVIPAPSATIRAVELNEFGQPIAYHPLSYTACEGEDVYLEMVGEPKYSYEWSDGSTGETANFTEPNGNLLPVGQHAYTVTVTDTETGCTVVVGPFPVTINGAPASVAISSNPPGPLCDGTEAVFSVLNPQPSLTYLWNTGDNGTSMAAAAAGSYLVQATNQFGCTAKSDPIEIHNAAAVGNAPAGCYTRCYPTDICLPQMPEIAAYQWFLNGTAIPAPAGTVANFIPTENGDYTVQMTSIHGCMGLSDPLSLTLEAPTGNIGGTVWLDVNENGIIDTGDTPLPGIGVLLAQNGANLDSLTSGAGGDFAFGEFPSENYQVLLDTATLPSILVPVIGSATAQLQGCHDSTGVGLLVKSLCSGTIATSLDLIGCEGDSVSYNGVKIPVGMTQQFTFTSSLGCDSVVTVTAIPYQWPWVFPDVIELYGCLGDSIFYAGEMLPVESFTIFHFQDYLGCNDSTIYVFVNSLPHSITTLKISTCPGDSVEYNGILLGVGQSMDFHYDNYIGCDSLVKVVVQAYPAESQQIALTSCPEEPIVFDNQTLMPGDTATFVYQNIHGCDSTVQMSVLAFPSEPPTELALAVCPSDSVVYNGETLWPGDVRNFVFQDQNGCDSTVNVSVWAYPAIAFSLFTEPICPGTSDGSIELDIAAGDPPMTAALDGGSFAQTAIFEGINGGSHDVQIRDAHGCQVAQSIEIQELAPLEVAAEDYVLPCAEPSITLHPTVLSHNGPVHWHWENGAETEWFKAEQAGVFTVKISDDCGTEERAISVAWGDGGPVEPFYVPNAFSPNNDGVNDVFKVYLAAGVHFDEFQLMVFDRWGNQLFVTEDPALGWNGIFRGQQMDPAVVVWYVVAKVTVCGRQMEVFKKGDVTVMK